MGKRTTYRPGAFSWVDLATTDAAAAKGFYTGLFGWEGDAGTGDGYTSFRLDGDLVCGLFDLSEGMRTSVMVPSWTSFVTVADADVATEVAVRHGGRVRSGPFDELDLGRTAVLEDPQGAVFAVWQPRARIGAERVNDVGCLCMNELATTDVGGAREFYQALFGWTTELVDTGLDGPTIVAAYNDGTLNATLSEAEAEGAGPHWRPYFTVEYVTSALERAQSLGATLAFGPIPISDGSIAALLDPQGALFALFEGEVDP